MAEWRKASETPAYDSLQEWIRNEARRGQKFVSVTYICDPLLLARIRWNDGSVQDVITDRRPDGQVCVVQVRPVEAAPPPPA
jgi:hypothetical protein